MNFVRCGFFPESALAFVHQGTLFGAAVSGQISAPLTTQPAMDHVVR